MREVYNMKYKKWGAGSAALFLSIFATSFSFTYINEKNIGEYMLGVFHIKLPTILISMLLYLISLYIGGKFPEDYGAKVGKIIATLFLAFTSIFVVGGLFFQ